jgi:hypothetical protein
VANLQNWNPDSIVDSHETIVRQEHLEAAISV